MYRQMALASPRGARRSRACISRDLASRAHFLVTPIPPASRPYLGRISQRPSDDDAEVSLMYSMTKHRDNLCLTDDDLEGLNYLYPTCFYEVETDAGTVPDQGMPYRDPQCVEPERKSVTEPPSPRTALHSCIDSAAPLTPARAPQGWLRLILAFFIPYVSITVFIFLLQCIVSWHMRVTSASSRHHLGETTRGALIPSLAPRMNTFARALRTASATCTATSTRRAASTRRSYRIYRTR